ncbi:ECF transporter S component [Stackebrandtia soli]|uniref:ECF transporter S component n=1 Tax=Stackebrandtia soli TaxID=1892856 RepID=UPI0039E80210
MTRNTNRWRTIDIVVAAVLAVAFGVIFWAWNFVWEGASAALAFYPPLKAIVYGLWMVPAILGMLVIRKPGAGLFTETVASTVSMLLGTSWGIGLVLQGAVQGAAGEAGFALGGYRRYGLPQALLGGALAGFAATVWDSFVWYGETDWLTFRIPFIAVATLSSAIIAGLGAMALTKALSATGALDRFPSGRDRAAV